MDVRGREAGHVSEPEEAEYLDTPIAADDDQDGEIEHYHSAGLSKRERVRLAGAAENKGSAIARMVKTIPMARALSNWEFER